METQEMKVYEYMKCKGSITRLQAMMDLGIANLPSRINHLRNEGVKIVTDMVEGKNRLGEKCKYAKYRLEKEGSTPTNGEDALGKNYEPV